MSGIVLSPNKLSSDESLTNSKNVRESDDDTVSDS